MLWVGPDCAVAQPQRLQMFVVMILLRIVSVLLLEKIATSKERRFIWFTDQDQKTTVASASVKSSP